MEAATQTRATRARRTPMTAPVPPPQPEPAPAPVLADVGIADAPPPRSVRKPFGARQQRLENPPIPGFQCRWFNDTPNRIQRALDAGYMHVTDNEGKPVKHPVGVAPTGGALIAYRMKIPVEFFNEDKAAKEAPRRQTDDDMRQRGAKDGSGYSSEGRPGYHPDRVASASMDADGRQTAAHWRESEK